MLRFTILALALLFAFAVGGMLHSERATSSTDLRPAPLVVWATTDENADSFEVVLTVHNTTGAPMTVGVSNVVIIDDAGGAYAAPDGEQARVNVGGMTPLTLTGEWPEGRLVRAVVVAVPWHEPVTLKAEGVGP
jgi:hypothetical protein